MAIEIERKYLVRGEDWRKVAIPVNYSQGYLIAEDDTTVRIRIAGDKAFITIKGITIGMTRKEFEYSIPVNDARDLLNLCHGLIVIKKRSKIEWEGKIWEIDEFEGRNSGLIIAEIELKTEDESFSLPPWIGEEVTGDMRYYNSWLSRHPYSEWLKKTKQD